MGFAERGILVLVPIGDQFEHGPLSEAELKELRVMGGMEFLDRTCVLRAPSDRPLARLRALFTMLSVGIFFASIVLAMTLGLALLQPKAETAHGFVEVAAESTSSDASDA